MSQQYLDFFSDGSWDDGFITHHSDSGGSVGGHGLLRAIVSWSKGQLICCDISSQEKSVFDES